MNAREAYVTYAQAKALKELGFDWPCRFAATSEDAPKGLYWTYPDDATNSCLYDRSFTIPTQAVACRWLREVEGLHVNIDMINERYNASIWSIKEGVYLWCDEEDATTYEGALCSGIDRAIELLKGGRA